jgi:DNA-binding transcriptional MocR family regulator
MTSPLCAELASRWLVDGTVERLISLRRQAMKPRHRLVSRTFGELAYRTRAGAYQVWLTLPERWTSEAFAAALLREGIRVSRAGEFRANGQPAPNAIRISLSATPRLEALERALETIRRLHDGSPPRSTLL